jgi:hypothetical protein
LLRPSSKRWRGKRPRASGWHRSERRSAASGRW